MALTSHFVSSLSALLAPLRPVSNRFVSKSVSSGPTSQAIEMTVDLARGPDARERIRGYGPERIRGPLPMKGIIGCVVVRIGSYLII